MSLAERLSALEDYESIRDPSPAGDRRRKLSFNPIPRDWVPPEDNPPPVPAFEVSQARRIGKDRDFIFSGDAEFIQLRWPRRLRIVSLALELCLGLPP